MKTLFHGVRVISFDLDDTLWPTMETIVAAEQALFAWLQEHFPALTEKHSIDSMRKQRRQLAQQYPHLAHDMNFTRQKHLEQLLESHGGDLVYAQRAVNYFQQHRNRVFPYPDVLPALNRLNKTYILVSVTNGTAEVEKTGLKGQFTHTLNAVDAGQAKPHPAIFHKLMEHTKTTPEQVIHVGDDPYRDIEPARKLGMRTVWVNRDRNQWPKELNPADAQVSSLNELLTEE